MLLELFTHFDKDRDGYLKFKDFVALCSEASQFSEVKQKPNAGQQLQKNKIKASHDESWLNLLKRPKIDLEHSAKHSNTPIRNPKFKALQELDESQRFMSTGSLLKANYTTTFGETSRKINEGFDLFANVNGGSFSKCLVNEYQQDFITDKQMRDNVRN